LFSPIIVATMEQALRLSLEPLLSSKRLLDSSLDKEPRPWWNLGRFSEKFEK